MQIAQPQKTGNRASEHQNCSSACISRFSAFQNSGGLISSKTLVFDPPPLKKKTIPKWSRGGRPFPSKREDVKCCCASGRLWRSRRPQGRPKTAQDGPRGPTKPFLGCKMVTQGPHNKAKTKQDTTKRDKTTPRTGETRERNPGPAECAKRFNNNQ